MGINTLRLAPRGSSDKQQPKTRTLVALTLAGTLGVSATSADATPTRPQSAVATNRDGCLPSSQPVVRDVNGNAGPEDSRLRARIRTCHDIARTPTVRQIINRGMADARPDAHTEQNQNEIKFRVESVIREAIEIMDRAHDNPGGLVSIPSFDHRETTRLIRLATNANEIRSIDDTQALRWVAALQRELQRHLARDLNNAAAGSQTSQELLRILAAHLYLNIRQIPANVAPRPVPPSPFGGMPRNDGTGWSL